VNADAYCPGGSVDITRAALHAAIADHLQYRIGGEVFAPLNFFGDDCLHGPDHERTCQCIDCPRKAADLGRSALSETTGEGK
jgi:hypothetical protein